jgi:hypothetical protein
LLIHTERSPARFWWRGNTLPFFWHCHKILHRQLIGRQQLPFFVCVVGFIMENAKPRPLFLSFWDASKPSRAMTTPQPQWRRMTAADMPVVMAVGDVAHPTLPEGDEVFIERLQFFPEGCLALAMDMSDNTSKVCGYAISDPIRKNQLPALDSLLGNIAPDADQCYIHHVVVMPELRGRGLVA